MQVCRVAATKYRNSNLKYTYPDTYTPINFERKLEAYSIVLYKCYPSAYLTIFHALLDLMFIYFGF